MKKSVMTKTLLASALTAVMGIANTSASAVVFNPFQITEASVPGGTVANPGLLGSNYEGKFTGNYTEIATFGAASACGGTNVCGTGSFSLLWNAGQVTATDGSTVLPSQIGATGSIIAQQYGLYAFFQGTDSFVLDTATGKATITINTGGNLNVYIDPNTNTTFVAPSSGGAAWAQGPTATDDYLIATGVPQSGVGNLDPTLPTCTGGINCGSFGETSSFALTSGDQSAFWTGTQDGTSYFTFPIPFYNLSFTSGQFDNFTPTGTQTIVGSLDASFGSVPEPESLALLGIGLLGMVGVLRRGRRLA